ncbi:MAG: tRNA uridine(34) 5-carboxymethylaminomethyl modification radical SAM/GNAT enzyme Elp3 [Candidatus Diapherotrites archaeon]|nr:tRNA uridine(34) 5-carboxymethylaminomethyl modification radical SAM/GNAT enzyme Elp3 [Candidatus Diapherotrites archaeon]
MNKSEEKYCKEIIELIEKGSLKSKAQLNKAKIELAKKYCLDRIPTNPTIMRYKSNKSEKIASILTKKPIRSSSGINVIAIMARPHKCPGNCIYCPSSQIFEETPKSYTGREPATMRALQAKFDPKKQVEDRIKQLVETGHNASKIELIIMGGTFLSTPIEYQKLFVKGAIDGVIGKKSKSLEDAKKMAEKSSRRIIGITFETRPDYCKKVHVNRMLNFGGTRCELGVQIVDDEIYSKIKRGHTVKDVTNATHILKDAGLKVCYHIMPGLPYTTPKIDLYNFKRLFSCEEFMPDNIKLYPCLVIKGTELSKMYAKGEYLPLDTEKATKLIVKMKRYVPYWVRIMRVQRDIPAQIIEAGVKKSNLRQIVQAEMAKKGLYCRCIRCREAKLKQLSQGKELSLEATKLFRDEYYASNGNEIFLSFEDKKREMLYAYCRLRIPERSYRREIADKASIIRELRVLGEPLLLGEKISGEIQHQGLGTKLVMEAERITKEDFERKNIFVISGLGVKEYYRKKFGYKNNGPYLYKRLL